MSLAGCCCGPQPSLPCSSCYGGNRCYPLQPSACVAGDLNRKYRFTATGGRVLSDYSYSRSIQSASWQCVLSPCQAFVAVCTGCQQVGFPTGNCSNQSIVVDLCTGPHMQCAKTVEATIVDRKRTRLSQVFKSEIANPNYTLVQSSQMMQSASCGAPLSYQSYICGAYPQCTPCSVPHALYTQLCNGMQAPTNDACEETPSHEWLYETASNATMELTVHCAGFPTPPLDFSTVSGSGINAKYFRRIAARQSAVGQTCPNPITGAPIPIQSDWGYIPQLITSGFGGPPLSTAFEAAPNTLVRTLDELNCDTLDAMHIKFDAYATFRTLPLGAPPSAPISVRSEVMGIYYGCPDLDVYQQANPQYKNRQFRLDRWTNSTRMIYGSLANDFTCSLTSACGNWAGFPLPNTTCWNSLPANAMALYDLISTGGPPAQMDDIGALFCASDSVVPPVPKEDIYGCWFGPVGAPIPAAITLERQGAW